MLSLTKMEPISDFKGEVKMFKIEMDPVLTSLGQEQQYDVFSSLRAGDMLELPALIFVETRFISKQRAEAEMAQQRLNPERRATISTLNYEPDLIPQISITPFANPPKELLAMATQAPVIVSQKQNIIPTIPYPTIGSENLVPIMPVKIKEITPLPKAEPKKTFANATVMAKVVSKEFGTNTDSENPTRDRGIQVKPYKTNSVAIQCCIDDDLDFSTLEEAPKSGINDNQPEENEHMKLLLYNCEKSLCHSNGKVECRLCGEVQSNLKKMESHLLLHFGPKVLCFRCGIYCENKIELRRHGCIGKRQSLKRLRCPYYNCNVSAISKWELYDHLNEHTFEHSYKCAGCKHKYFTVGEFKLHLKLNKKCQKVKHSQRMPYDKKNLKSSRDRLYRNRVRIGYAFNGVKLMRISPLNSKCKTSACKQRCQLCFKVLSNKFKLKNHHRHCYLQYNIRYKWQCLKSEE